MAKDIILATENVKKYFPVRGGKVVKAVDGVSVEVERGKTLGIVGESGCGKSTLGRTIIRIYDPTEGRILLDGRDISGKSTKRFRQELARSIQMIFQDPYACLNPRMTVTDLIAEGWDLQQRHPPLQARTSGNGSRAAAQGRAERRARQPLRT